MIWVQFAATALVIVLAGVRLARYGDVLGEKTGLGRSWIGVVLLAATTSLPELFTGFGATALAALPDIALGDVLGSCKRFVVAWDTGAIATVYMVAVGLSYLLTR